MGPSFELDLGARTMTVHRTDGETVRLALPDGVLDFETHLEHLALDADAAVLRVGMPDGTAAVVELAAGGQPIDAKRARRPVVYLDQNQWSRVSAWRNGRHLPASEASAAAILAGAVDSEKLLLPASAGNFVETVPLYGEPRVLLASTVLSLSRGWQMRNPLHIRLEELARALSGHAPVAGDVFAPAADVFFATPRRSLATDLPPLYAEIAAEMTSVLGIYDAILDPEAIVDPEGTAQTAAETWARAHAELAEQLRSDGASRDLAWRVVHARLLLDLADELARAGMALDLPAARVIDRLCEPDDLIGQMPFLARMRHLLFARVRNTTQRWEANDLIDSIFLSCAAGYADLVIGERTTIGYLRQAKAVPSGASLTTSLSEGVEALRDMGCSLA